MHHARTNPNQPATPERISVLASLRALLPNRRLRLEEALRLAELQANKLLVLRGALDVPVASEIVSELPGVAIDYEPEMPASGASDWDSRHRQWVITLRASEPDTRHRFTLLHEYKHIIDHGSPGIVDIDRHRARGNAPAGRPPAETVADYFAACVLMPKRLLKAAYFSGTQSIETLAEVFGVSPTAMGIRLTHLGLKRSVDPEIFTPHRHMPSSITHHRRYQRSLSASWGGLEAMEVAV